MVPLSVLILTRDEEANIARTLDAVRWVPRVLVIDSGSTDRTVEIARSFPNVEVVERAFDTHANQWNVGLDRIETEWVLTLDADYVLTPDLQAELQSLEPPSDVVGYWASFVYKISGRSLRASVYPPRVVLFRIAKARYVDEGHTQDLRIRTAKGELCSPGKLAAYTTGEGGKLTPKAFASRQASPTGKAERVLSLVGKIHHDDRKSFSHWIRSQKRYAALEARHLLKSKNEKVESGKDDLRFQDRLRLMMFFAPPIMFVYLLFGRLLILDGWPGWWYVAQRTIAEVLLSVEIISQRFRGTDCSANE